MPDRVFIYDRDGALSAYVEGEALRVNVYVAEGASVRTDGGRQPAAMTAGAELGRGVGAGEVAASAATLSSAALSEGARQHFAPLGVHEIRPCGGSRPEGAASLNASGSGEGGRETAQGYSAAAEAPLDSGSRSGGRNAGACRDGGGASPEPGRSRGQPLSRECADDLGAVGDVGSSCPRGVARPSFGPSPGTGQESPGTLPSTRHTAFYGPHGREPVAEARS